MVNPTKTIQNDYKTKIHFTVLAAIPCYNTESTISEVISKTKKYVDKVIVIDDGSTDKTADNAEAAGATVISHGSNKGYGEAIKSCFTAARSSGMDVLIIIDGDGQHYPCDIPPILAPIIEGSAEMVIGSRLLMNRYAIPLYRKFGIRVINFLWNFGSKYKISDTQSGFRAYRKEIFQNMTFAEKGMNISIEIIQHARNHGIRIEEAPISCSYLNNNSNMSIKAFFHGFNVAFFVLMIRIKNIFSLRSSKKRYEIST